MTSYYIFKTDNNTDKTVLVCNGRYGTTGECRRHWLAYEYGFMDCAFEVYGAGNFTIKGSIVGYKFTFRAKNKNVSYFMLFDKEGQELIKKIS